MQFGTLFITISTVLAFVMELYFLVISSPKEWIGFNLLFTFPIVFVLSLAIICNISSIIFDHKR